MQPCSRIIKQSILIALVLIIVLLPAFTVQASELPEEETHEVYGKAKVIEVLEEQEISEISGDTNKFVKQILQVKILKPLKNEIMEIEHIACYSNIMQGIPVEKGDKVILYMLVNDDKHITEAYIQDLDRSFPIAILLGLFVGILITMGGRRGLAGLVIISLTGFLITYFLVPYVLNGFSPLWAAIIICFLVTLVAMPLVGGRNYSSLGAIIGVLSGVTIAGVLAYFSADIMRIIGVDFEYVNLLQTLPNTGKIDIRGIFFASLLIGTLGAVMDTCISISSSIREMVSLNNNLSIKHLYKLGMNVGKDVMGMMCSTLILAYAGSYIPLLLLLYANNIPALNIINSDMIVSEVVRSISGSIGICLCIPITAAGTAYLSKMRKA
jgi:uncharacterized membrane protein